MYDSMIDAINTYKRAALVALDEMPPAKVLKPVSSNEKVTQYNILNLIYNQRPESGFIAITLTIPPSMKVKNRVVKRMITPKQYTVLCDKILDIVASYRLLTGIKVIGYFAFELHAKGGVHAHGMLYSYDVSLASMYYITLLFDVAVKCGFNAKGIKIETCRNPQGYVKYIAKEMGEHPMRPLIIP